MKWTNFKRRKIHIPYIELNGIKYYKHTIWNTIQLFIIILFLWFTAMAYWFMLHAKTERLRENFYEEHWKINFKSIEETIWILKAQNIETKKSKDEITGKILEKYLQEFTNDKYAAYISKADLWKDLLPTYDWIGIVVAKESTAKINEEKEEFKNKPTIEDIENKMRELVIEKLNDNEEEKKDKKLIITEILEWSPSAQMWFKVWDIILSINDKEISTFEELREETTKSKHLKIKFKRDGKIEFKEVDTWKIILPFVHFLKRETNIGDKKFNIWYIQIERFWENTYNELKSILEKEANDLDWYIFNLKDNIWGYLWVTEKMLNLFIKEKGIEIATFTENINWEIKERKMISEGWWKFFKPMIIMQNENSASASELFTLALNNIYDNKVLIFWDLSYWKRSIQSTFLLSNWDAIKLTTWWWKVNYNIPNKENDNVFNLMWKQRDVITLQEENDLKEAKKYKGKILRDYLLVELFWEDEYIKDKIIPEYYSKNDFRHIYSTLNQMENLLMKYLIEK